MEENSCALQFIVKMIRNGNNSSQIKTCVAVTNIPVRVTMRSPATAKGVEFNLRVVFAVTAHFG